MFFLFIGITDDGFEMLEQLAYLYLANNKVSHGRLSSQRTRTHLTNRVVFLPWCNVTVPAPRVCALTGIEKQRRNGKNVIFQC